jgi:hypothetical protein
MALFCLLFKFSEIAVIGDKNFQAFNQQTITDETLTPNDMTRK